VWDFGYIYCNTLTDSASLYCNGTCVREDNASAASGGWGSDHIVGENN
jgi:hypothetical protein